MLYKTNFDYIDFDVFLNIDLGVLSKLQLGVI